MPRPPTHLGRGRPKGDHAQSFARAGVAVHACSKAERRACSIAWRNVARPKSSSCSATPSTDTGPAWPSPGTMCGPACGGPWLARGGPPTAAPQGRGRGGTRRSVSPELACSNNSRGPDTIRRPAWGGPGPAGAGTPITAPQWCGHGVTRRSAPQELACSHNNRSPGTMCGHACGGPGPAGGGPPITAPQGCGSGITRRSVPQEPARHDNSRSRGARRAPARGSNTMSNRFQQPRLLWGQPPAPVGRPRLTNRFIIGQYTTLIDQ